MLLRVVSANRRANQGVASLGLGPRLAAWPPGIAPVVCGFRLAGDWCRRVAPHESSERPRASARAKWLARSRLFVRTAVSRVLQRGSSQECCDASSRSDEIGG